MELRDTEIQKLKNQLMNNEDLDTELLKKASGEGDNRICCKLVRSNGSIEYHKLNLKTCRSIGGTEAGSENCE